MFKLEVPDIFLNANCPRCKMRHAPIRDCVDKEGNKLYFDAVLLNGSQIVAFNGTPEETKKYLLSLDQEDRNKVRVIEGLTLQTMDVEDYLAR